MAKNRSGRQSRLTFRQGIDHQMPEMSLILALLAQADWHTQLLHSRRTGIDLAARVRCTVTVVRNPNKLIGEIVSCHGNSDMVWPDLLASHPF